MANIPFETSPAVIIFIPQVREANSRRTRLASMTCTEIYGNGARTIGWMITHPLPEMGVLINIKTTIIASHAEAHGMNRPNSAAVPRACECWEQMQMSLWGFGWFVRLPEVEKTQSLMIQEH